MGCNGVAVNLTHLGVFGLGLMIGLLKGFENKLVAKALVSFGSTIQIPESEADIARCCHCKSPGKINSILKIGAEIPGMHGIGIKAVQGQRNLPGGCLAQKQLMLFGKQYSIGG